MSFRAIGGRKRKTTWENADEFARNDSKCSSRCSSIRFDEHLAREPG